MEFQTIPLLARDLTFSNSNSGTCASPQIERNKSLFSCVQFVRNYDGDTLTVNIPNAPEPLGKNISVRVKSMDTPEIKGRGACEKQAAKKAKKLCVFEAQEGPTSPFAKCRKR